MVMCVPLYVGDARACWPLEKKSPATCALSIHHPLLQLPSETEHPSEQKYSTKERAAVVLGVLEGVRDLL